MGGSIAGAGDHLGGRGFACMAVRQESDSVEHGHWVPTLLIASPRLQVMLTFRERLACNPSSPTAARLQPVLAGPPAACRCRMGQPLPNSR